MKILITTDAYYPMTNGVVISTDILYKQLKRSGHEVRILTLSSDRKEHRSGDIFYFSSFNINIYPDARIIWPSRNHIISDIIRWKPDIIHSQTEFSTMLIAKYIRKKLNIPHIHTYHTLYEDYLHYLPGGKLIRKPAISKLTGMLLSTFDTVIAPTEKVKEKLESYKVASNIEIAPTGIRLDKFRQEVSLQEKRELLSRYGLSSDDKILIYVGRIAEEKNIEEIISFYKSSLSKVKNTKLLIVGGGPYLEKLKNIVKALGIESKVKFTGMVKNDEVYKYYKLGNIFVTASTSETQGITYIEAIASGLPVLCRWDKCVEDVVISGQTGFVYKDEEEFVKALALLCSNIDIEERMVNHLQSKAEEYSDENFGLKVISIYNKLLTYNNLSCPA